MDPESDGAHNSNPLPRDLQLWPELVDVGLEVHSGRRKSLYAASLSGRRAVLKVSRPMQSLFHLLLTLKLSLNNQQSQEQSDCDGIHRASKLIIQLNVISYLK
jgi:hypothetical protein